MDPWKWKKNRFMFLLRQYLEKQLYTKLHQVRNLAPFQIHNAYINIKLHIVNECNIQKSVTS